MLEVIAGLVAVKRPPRTVGPLAAGSFADEHDFRVDRTIQLAKNGSFVRERGTDPAALSLGVKDFE